MSHKNSQVKALLNDDVLAIGILPESFTPEELAPYQLTVEELAAQIERGWAAVQAAGVVGEVCSVSKDPDEAEAEIRKRFAERTFGLALVGSGVRLLPVELQHESGEHARSDPAPARRLGHGDCRPRPAGRPSAPPICAARPAVVPADTPRPADADPPARTARTHPPLGPPDRTGLPPTPQVSHAGQ